MLTTEPRAHVIRVRVSRSERDQIRKTAADLKVSVSDVVRMATAKFHSLDSRVSAVLHNNKRKKI